jgi:NADH dehydrogenase FAD-containing subunit
MKKKLLLVGGGHVHLTILKRLGTFLEDDVEVTLVAPSDYHYYSGMAPGLLSGYYRPAEARFNVKKMADSSGARFIRGKAAAVYPEQKEVELTDGARVGYDIVSFNTGSEIPGGPFKTGADNVYPVKPIENFLSSRDKIIEFGSRGEVKVLVAGGGAAGVEIAGNLRKLAGDKNIRISVTLVTGERLLSRFAGMMGKKARASLVARGVRIIEKVLVNKIDGGEAELDTGERLPFDVAYNVIGIRPSGIFRNSKIPTGDDGGLLVNRYLQSVEFPEVFGGGDSISFQPFPLDKVGVYAVKQNPILYNNIHAALGRGRMKEFRPRKRYLAILNMGDGRGIFIRNGIVAGGKWALALKDRLDRSFMKRFQVSGELEE